MNGKNRSDDETPGSQVSKDNQMMNHFSAVRLRKSVCSKRIFNPDVRFKVIVNLLTLLMLLIL